MVIFSGQPQPKRNDNIALALAGTASSGRSEPKMRQWPLVGGIKLQSIASVVVFPRQLRCLVFGETGWVEWCRLGESLIFVGKTGGRGGKWWERMMMSWLRLCIALVLGGGTLKGTAPAPLWPSRAKISPWYITCSMWSSDPMVFQHFFWWKV